MALVSHAATLASRIPFLHFMDGFRTSHEINKIDLLDDQSIVAMLNRRAIAEHRGRSLDPDRPVLGGTAQNPDVFFQREKLPIAFMTRLRQLFKCRWIALQN